MTSQKSPPIFIGETTQKPSGQRVTGNYVNLHGEVFYKIQNYDAMKPFFMSIVSSSNHWLFISSTGGISAGRVSAEQSLFPYYTEDKLTENYDNTGNKSIFLVTTHAQETFLWEPFSERQQGIYHIERNIYKNVTGTAVIFEEINASLGLTYQYAWRTGDTFGFIKTSWLKNSGETSCQVELVDGLQNILPARVTMATQLTFSVLLDAYKRSEINPENGLAIFALNSTLTDLPEPSESLLATTAFQVGLDQVDYLLSSTQLDNFRTGRGLVTDREVRGQRCAYFVHTKISLAAGMERKWHLVADVSQDSAAIVHRSKKLGDHTSAVATAIEDDIAANDANLQKIVACTDGLQVSNNHLHCSHHFANVMFNGMRGGVFADQYRMHKKDFLEFTTVRNRTILDKYAAFFSELPSETNISTLFARAESTGAADLIRLSYAYLPLSFSRRHGDPSRPWNRFAINIKKEDGSQQLDYEGNWRDIFQNWEALAYSYPEYVESMICTFLNATTPDGYNPYRITRQGVDWELPEPNNPWANIGYWSDHQIIYLQKLMEISDRLHPGRLQAFLNRPVFSYANVPYRIKPYADLRSDPYNTIDFDWDAEQEVERRVQERGTDGKLVYTQDRQVLQVTLAEKLLTLLLAKLVNFVPEGGIWMNTQRPEWNDANNALVGKGLSVVTLCYLRRTIVFCIELLKKSTPGVVQINTEVQQLFSHITQILIQFQGIIQEQQTAKRSFNAEQRRAMMDALGTAGSDYRWKYYSQGFSGDYTGLQVSEIVAFLELALQYVEHSLRANRRSDNLYHAYNILHLDHQQATVSHLYEMLEGQVAILSSGMLSGEESLALLESLRHGPLYRADQQSYILYPDRVLPGFLEKNCITPAQVKDLALVTALERAGDRTLIIRDEEGNYHFNGYIRNLKDVTRLLEELKQSPQVAALVETEAAKIEALFENTFHHNEFTGRSGTFFAYEGLGSIYWHMVSKLLLAVQETIIRTRSEPAAGALLEKYADIRKGQCFNKTPDDYGAFPTDPYSHTPKNQGARQPGMTGLVKEEILSRQAELGLTIENGSLAFDFLFLDKNEMLVEPSEYTCWNVNGQQQRIELPVGSLAYAVCQVPVILQASPEKCISVHFTDGAAHKIEGHVLDAANSLHIFQRDGKVHHLEVSVPPDR